MKCEQNTQMEAFYWLEKYLVLLWGGWFGFLGLVFLQGVNGGTLKLEVRGLLKFPIR